MWTGTGAEHRHGMGGAASRGWGAGGYGGSWWGAPTPSSRQKLSLYTKGGGGIIVVGDNCRMADKIKNIASYFFAKNGG